MSAASQSIAPVEIDRTGQFLSRYTTTAVDQVEDELVNGESSSWCDNNCWSCLAQWWNVTYRHQQFIVHTVEKTLFHVVIIILVLVDCVLIIAELMLDFIDLKDRCGKKNESSTRHEEGGHSKLEVAIEVLHYGSIFLLAVFVLEVLIKIYAFGKKWWNFRQKKMEWLDAIIVIVSFIIDIYFLQRSNVLAEISLLFISFRLWRIIRIINSVAQSIRSQDETAKKHLASTYVKVVESLLNVLAKKTEATVQLRQNLTEANVKQVIDNFSGIDDLCRSIVEHCPKPSSRNAVTDLAHNLEEALEKIRLTSSTLGVKR